MAMLAIDARAERDTLQHRLAQTKLSLCNIALCELRNTWPLAGWIMVLFFKFSQEQTNPRGTPEASSPDVQGAELQSTETELDVGAFLASPPIHFPTDWDLPAIFPDSMTDPLAAWDDQSTNMYPFNFQQL